MTSKDERLRASPGHPTPEIPEQRISVSAKPRSSPPAVGNIAARTIPRDCSVTGLLPTRAAIPDIAEFNVTP